MSIRKIEQIKEGRFFRLSDLIIYGVILIVTAALFLAYFLTRDNSAADGFKVRYGDRVVFTYYYDKDEYDKIKYPENIEITSDDSEKLCLTFYTDGKKGYNKITVDKKERTAFVQEADCTRKDCVHSAPLRGNSTVISCLSHNMHIEPLKRKVVDDEQIPLG